MEYFKEVIIMAKKITCKQMGGPCDFEITGETPEEIMQKGGEHVNQMADTDEGHKAAKDMMDNSDDAAKAEWFKTFNETFASAPDA